MSPYSYEPPNAFVPYSGTDFDHGVRNAFQNMGRVDVTPRAFPWSGIDLPMVTDLPQSSNDGAEVNYIADATNGVVWRMVYRRATNKWHYIGGPPLRNVNNTLSQTITSATFVDMPTSAGPSLTAPFAGVYSVRFFYTAQHDTATGFSIMAIKNGSDATSDDDGVYSQAHAANCNMSATGLNTMTVASAGTVLKAQYRNGSGVGTVTLNNSIGQGLSLEITPIMVTA